MITFALVNIQSGEIVKSGKDESISALLPLEDEQHELFTHLPDGVSTFTHYVDYTIGDYVLKPSVPAFANPYDLTALPSGSVVYVTDEAGARQEITDLSEPLTLAGPKTYSIAVRAPFPYQSMTEDVDIE